jgi:cysteine-rich repeat protein
MTTLALTFGLLVSAWQASAAVPAADPDGINRLRNVIGGTSVISLDRATGTVSFLRIDQGGLDLSTARGASLRQQTISFLSEHGAAFGLRSAADELVLVDESTDSLGHSHLRYRQVSGEVPVFGSDLRSHFNARGALVAISASIIPIGSLALSPAWTSTQVSAVARHEVARLRQLKAAPEDLRALNPELIVFRTGYVQGVAGRNHLAYRVEVVNYARSIREFVFVDAHTGKVLDRITGIHDSMDRQIYNLGYGPSYHVWGEGDALPYVGDDAVGINDLINFAEDSYNLYLTMSNGGFPSYDAADSTMHSVLNDPAISCPNANWNGVSTNYCNGTSADDVVTHEWTHAYTDFTHNLVYQWQPGALNEAYSDIFGELADQLNGAGTDAPGGVRSGDGSGCSMLGAGAPATDNTYRWLIGEDATAFSGAIRDMWRPECYGDPGKVSSTAYWCSTVDGGGVHTNSGVPNHGFSLLADGGTFNGQSITGLGLTRAAHIYWRAMTIYQGPVSDFADHADALEASCADLVGADLPTLSTDTPTPSPSGITISAADCTELAEAIAAVELRSEPSQCGFETILDGNPPPLCEGLGAKQTVLLTDWESGLSPWTAGTRNVAQPSSFDTADWAAVSGLPDGRTGSAAFVEDYTGGNCVDDIEAGVLYLQSPEITIPTGTEVARMAVDHWIATEAFYDGGNIKISVNGGAFELIPHSAFDLSPYNSTLDGTSDNPMAGEPAFTGSDEGSLDGSWGQSHISLLGIAAAGDTVELRFELGVDGCSGVTGWYVDEVEVYSCADELAPSDCGNGIIDLGELCDDGNSVNADGCSNSCQVEPGWTCSDPVAAAPVDDPSFETGSPNAYWAESSSNFGTPLCTAGSCGLDAAYDGSWFAWFGGIAAYEEGGLDQTVTIPAGNSTLRFHLEIGVCDSARDYLEVLIDDQQVWSVNGSDPACGAAGGFRDVDISGSADGQPHELSFHSEIFNSNGGLSNFFVDMVSLPGAPSVCTAVVSEIFADGFESGNHSAWSAHLP